MYPNDKCYRLLLITLILVLLLPACNRPKGVMGPNKMATVLTELHKLDAALVITNRAYQTGNDTTYGLLLEKYGISRTELDSSLVWYARNPKRFKKVYAKVMSNIEAWEKDVNNFKYHPDEKINTPEQSAPLFLTAELWTGDSIYHLLPDSLRREVDFNIEMDSLQSHGLYILSFRQRIAPEDSAAERKACFRLNYCNGSSDSISTVLHNDSLLRRFTFYLHARDSLRVKSLTGKLAAGKDYKGRQHLQIDSISLLRRYRATTP